jgi:hypothetical protein
MFEGRQELYGHREAILAVYLGNDLIDNTLGFPLQADRAKPFFELSGGRLVLRHTPVPKVTKPSDAPRSMAEMVMVEPPQPSRLRAVLGRSALARRGFAVCDAFQRREVEWSPATSDQFSLFAALVGRLVGRLDPQWTLPLVVIPGRSLVEEPHSLSAQYQQMVRQQILAHDWGPRVRVVDAAKALVDAHREGRRCYFPNEGHLNEEGHRVVGAAVLDVEAPTPNAGH